MENYLTGITDFVTQYGYYFIIPLLTLENVPVIGFFAPGMSVLFLTGYFSNVLPGGNIVAFLVAWITIIFADTFWYLLGYYVQNHRWLAKIRSHSPNVEELLTKNRFYTLSLYQFAPFLRMFLPFSLGVYRYQFVPWLALVTVGSGLYTLVFFGFGVMTNQLLTGVAESNSALKSLSLIMGGVGFLYIFFLLISYLRIRARNKNLKPSNEE